MFSGVTVSDREGNAYYGGGVTVEGGTFHMYGGTIRNCGIKGGSICWGGGVAVMFGGSFIMDGGEIMDCYADSLDGYTSFGGGVFVAYGSSFTMNGGAISGNRADVGSGSLSEFHAKYEFQSATPGMSLPDDVLNLAPEDPKPYATNATLSAIAPAKRVVEVPGGTWTFKGYDRESVVADATTADAEGNVTFVSIWEFTEKTGSSTGSGDGSNGAAGGSQGAQGGASSGLPQTGDVASAAPYLALAASAASLLSALWLSRR